MFKEFRFSSIFLMLVASFVYLSICVSAVEPPENWVDVTSLSVNSSLSFGGKYYVKSYVVTGHFDVLHRADPPFANCGLRITYSTPGGDQTQDNWPTRVDISEYSSECRFTINMETFFASRGATAATLKGYTLMATGDEVTSNVLSNQIVVDTVAPTTVVSDATMVYGNQVQLTDMFSDNNLGVTGSSVKFYSRWNGGAWSLLGSGEPNAAALFHLTHTNGVYDFYVIGTDAVGNVETKAPTAEKSVNLGAMPTNTPAPGSTSTPTSTINPSVTVTPGITDNATITPTQQLDTDNILIMPQTGTDEDVPAVNGASIIVPVLIGVGVIGLLAIGGLLLYVKLRKRNKIPVTVQPEPLTPAPVAAPVVRPSVAPSQASEPVPLPGDPFKQ